MATWKARPGKIAHAVMDLRSKKALCGVKVSSDALHVVARILKCAACKKVLRKTNAR